MAVTTEEFKNGTGSATEFTFAFPYLQEADVKVATYASDAWTETTAFTFKNATTIKFNSAPASGTGNIRIFRDTDVDTAKGIYSAGSTIRAQDLNDNQDQVLFALQEEQSNLITNSQLGTNSVKSANIVDGTIVNADVNASAAIAGTKISPNFGSQAVATTGTLAAGATTVTGNITVSGTVDGRDLQTDGTKLDGIEASATGDQTNAEIRAAVEAASDSNVFTDADHSKLNAIEANATADQTNAEIRTAVEAASDSNVFTDADHSKLNAIEASADVTDATNVDAAGAVMNSDLDGKGELLVGDGSGDPTALAVGTDGFILKADSSEATGVKWAAAGAGGDVNQNAFSNIAVSGQTTVAADSATDTFTIVGGTNVTVTTDASADSVTIAASGGEVTVQDEGNSLSTAATTLNFVGSGVTASGTGATKTITISGGGGAVTTDYQYLELKAHNNASGAFSAGSADYELVTKGTTTAVSPGQAAALLISIGGVIQEPNTGTSIGSNTGFCIDGSSIHFGANLAAHPDFVIWMKGSGSHVVADDSVTAAKIDLSIVQGDIIHGTGTNTWTNLAKGTAGQVLKMNSGATAPEWSSSVGGLSGGSDTTYSISCVDGDNTDEEKIRLTAGGSGSGTDDIVLEAGTGLSIARDADKITFTNTVSGTTTFVGLTDTPANFTNAGGKFVAVNSGASALEYVTAPAGSVADGCIFENDQTISNNHTIASGKGAHSVGPITVNATVTVNGNWVVS